MPHPAPSPTPDLTGRDTIVAIASGQAAAGVGIIRLSGPLSHDIAARVCGVAVLKPRYASHRPFRSESGEVLDDGIVLYFPGPRSFTGEDVVELQAHGSPAVLASLVALCVRYGARRARPGEFSERAFLEGRIDLLQAEAIADLIAATDERAARAARRSLQGDFSKRVDEVSTLLLNTRIHVEAAIDFVDESLETLGLSAIESNLNKVDLAVSSLLEAAQRGRRLNEGLHAVLLGAPNAGKSSLLNALAGYDRAIVTDVAGTTRDLLHEVVRVDGVSLELVDTAGLRDSSDAIEMEGIRRARAQASQADLALIVVDPRDDAASVVMDDARNAVRRLWIYNKSDLVGEVANLLHEGEPQFAEDPYVQLSAKTGENMESLHEAIRNIVSDGAMSESTSEFSARARHTEALQRTQEWVAQARMHLMHEDLELTAEALRIAHDTLGELTGRISPDELLGHIFSSFCIGK